jgi:hypothetical protein
MIIIYRSFLLLVILSVYQPAYSQDRNKDAEKYARTYCQMLANSCSMAPKNLEIKLEKSVYNTNPKLGPIGWRIWSRIVWRGQVSRMNYKVSVYLEVNEPVNGKPGKTTLFFLDYSYLLAFRCIKDENTKPARLPDGKIKFCRYREFEYFKP